MPTFCSAMAATGPATPPPMIIALVTPVTSGRHRSSLATIAAAREAWVASPHITTAESTLRRLRVVRCRALGATEEGCAVTTGVRAVPPSGRVPAHLQIGARPDEVGTAPAPWTVDQR